MIFQGIITLGKPLGEADADFSMDREEFASMVEAIRDTEKLLGKIDYTMTEKKKKSRRFSRSLYVTNEIKRGEIFTEINIRSVRPGFGLHPKYLEEIIGKTAQRDYHLDDRLTMEDLWQ